MIAWYKGLTVLEQIYFWLGIVSTILLVVQIILLSLSSFGGDVDIDGDGDIDVDTDSGISLFSLKSITAFFAVGSWIGLLVCALVAEELQWISVICAVVAGLLAMLAVVFILKAMLKLQCSGNLVPEKLIGQRATVYVSIPPARTGRGKITLTAQGKYMELDAITDSTERLNCDEAVEITSTDADCIVVKPVSVAQGDEKN
jgi:membrane protein implicated in regulation of membrane protease activity